jgi:hypothetical protein
MPLIDYYRVTNTRAVSNKHDVETFFKGNVGGIFFCLLGEKE